MTCVGGVAGLNVYSMLKHATLVLTVAAVDRIEERLLTHMHSVDVEREGKPSPGYTPKTFHKDLFSKYAEPGRLPLVPVDQ